MYKGVGGGGVSGGRGWAARGGLNPPLGLFGLTMSPEVPAISPNMLRWHKRHLITAGVNFRPVPSM